VSRSELDAELDVDDESEGGRRGAVRIADG
jgi:hypothetical protein